MEPLDRVDERRLRFERGLAAVLLLAGYVWRRDLVIPVVAIGVAIPLLPGSALRPFAVPFDRLVGPRLEPTRRTVGASRVHLGDLFVAGALAIASALLVVTLGIVARNIALVVAAILALEAASGISVGAWIMKRLRRRHG